MSLWKSDSAVAVGNSHRHTTCKYLRRLCFLDEGLAVADAEVRIGSSVLFRLGDVVFPDLDDWLDHAGPELLLTGEVVLLSDSGGEPDCFAVVDVRGLYRPLIVSAERLRDGLYWRSDPVARRMCDDGADRALGSSRDTDAGQGARSEGLEDTRITRPYDTDRTGHP